MNLLPFLSERCPNRRDILLKIFFAGTKDNKHIRSTISTIYGRFLASLTDPPLEMLTFYVKSIKSQYKSCRENVLLSRDEDVSYNYAYCFPAAVLKFPKNWEDLREVYLILHKDISQRIKRTLSSSIGCVVNLIGETAAQKDIMPIFNKLMFDEEERVSKDNLLNNIPALLNLITDKQKQQYFSKISRSINYSENWHANFKKLTIIRKVSEIYEEDFIFSKILCIFINFTFDEVNSLREEAMHLMTDLIKILFTSYAPEMRELVKNYALSRFSWARRLFVKNISSFADNQKVFSTVVSPFLEAYVKENSFGNIILLSESLKRLWEQFEWAREDSNVCSLINSVKQRKHYILEERLGEIKVEQTFSSCEMALDCNMDYVKDQFEVNRLVKSKLKGS